MAEDCKHAIWLRPFGEAAFELRQRIKKLSEQFHTPPFEPHITLLSGLRRGETELTQLSDTLAGSLSPFEVELTELGYRDHYYQSLFIHVKQTPAFINAQNTAEKLFGCKSQEPYRPHLSLLYGNIPVEEKRKVMNTMRRSFPITFQVHSLLLIQSEGEVKDWKKVHTAEFKHS